MSESLAIHLYAIRMKSKAKNFVVIIVYHGDCRRSSCNYNGHHIDNKCNGHSQKHVRGEIRKRHKMRVMIKNWKGCDGR